jgi:uncharacterized protein YdeI (YjbR/CyaY-like superfamily)
METFYPQTLQQWHEWLIEHATTEQEIWVIFYKPGSGRGSIAYEEAVEEAVCFGWVDSLIKNLDGISHARKFTPRKPGSTWSETNIARAGRMIAAGRMTQAGLALFKESNLHCALNGQSRKDLMESWRTEMAVMLPPEVKAIYDTFPPSHQRQYAGWVMSAKKTETRQKRLEELCATLLRGEELGLK